MAAWIEEGRTKIRRATRHDLSAVGGLLGRAIPLRFGRRAVADRRDEVYVADEIGQGVVGVIGLAYRRSLPLAGVVVDVDPLVGARDAVVVGLVDFGLARARARGCVRFVVTGAPALPRAGVAATTEWTAGTTRIVCLRDAG